MSITLKKTIYHAFKEKNILINGLMKKGYERIDIRTPALNALRDKTVIDFGCHVGVWSFFLSQFAKKVIGVDRKLSCIERANSLNSVLKIPNIVFVQGNQHSLREICQKYNANALFTQKTLGTIKETKDIFHTVCWDFFDIIVSDYNFKINTNYEWVIKKKIDNLFIINKGV